MRGRATVVLWNRCFIGDRVAKGAMLTSLVLGGFIFGYCSRAYSIFPHSLIVSAAEAYKELRERPTWQREVVDKAKGERALSNPVLVNQAGAFPGVNALDMIDGKYLVIRLVDMDGKQRHEWKIDWFSIWPDATHVPPGRLPKSRPGTHVHGFVILESGDVVFNFSSLGLMRLDPCGKVVWKLPRLTHHSVHLDEDGTLWVSAGRYYTEVAPPFPNHGQGFDEPTVLQVSQNGEVLQEFSVVELLMKNGYAGLLYMSTAKLTVNMPNVLVTGDTLHLNDVETFPRSMAPGFFVPGDVMISLRNVNAVIVFSPDTMKIKLLRQKDMIRQHDPDFVDGNTISVYDNNHVVTHERWRADKTYGGSRILILSALSDETRVYYKANDFYNATMGKHQWLPNRNLLITESRHGRGFEVDPSGKIVWEYLHMSGPGYSAEMQEVQRIPERVAATVVKRVADGCTN